VSRAIATTHGKKRTSARNNKTVDVGVLSFAKKQLTYTQTSDRIQPGSPKADRVFVCGMVGGSFGMDPAHASGRGDESLHRARAGRLVSMDEGIRFGAPGAPAFGRGLARGRFCTGLLLTRKTDALTGMFYN
jgi:hypothetical protein